MCNVGNFRLIHWNYVFGMKYTLQSKSMKINQVNQRNILKISIHRFWNTVCFISIETSSLKSNEALFLLSYNKLFVLFLAIFQTLILNLDFGTAKATHFEQGSTTSWQAQCADCTCKICRYFEATKIWCQTPHMLLV